MTSSSATQGEVPDLLVTYVQAIQNGDTSTVDQLISQELRERISTKGTGADFAAKLEQFVARERDKLMVTAPVAGVVDGQLAVEASEVVGDGEAVSVGLTINGQAAPRPVYFVRDGAGYKINLVKPDIAATESQILEGNTYIIKNDDSVDRNFSCSGQGGARVAARQSLQKFCDDSCDTVFDGTLFTVNRSSAHCDYNTFGVDMFIRDNRPVCAGPC